ncbi:MAG: HlyD family efflux transporter periplasmic adaptor subunit [Lysobacter sp.]|nr:HlyD family efflux transporter periplasmic adaptor subunit [Lysobacter sp.]
MDIKRPDLKAKKRRTFILWSSGVAVAALGLVVLAVSIGPALPKADRDTLWTGQVKRGELLRDVRAPGMLVPKSTRWIATDTAARVERILMKPGAAVAADTVIIELSNPELQEQLANAEMQLRVEEADIAARRAELQSRMLDMRSKLADVQTDYESARLQVEAETNLVDQRIISRVAYERNVLNANSLRQKLALERERVDQERRNVQTQLAGQLAKLGQLRASRDLKQQQVEGLRVRAGIDGVVQQMMVQEGQQVTEGANLARIAKPDVLIAQLRVPEAEARDIATGQSVELKIHSDTVAGRVARIDPAVSNSTVSIDVETLAPLPAGARPDLSIDGRIEIERLRDVLYVSRPAGSQAMSSSGVFLVDSDGDSARRVQVRFGRSSVNQIVVEEGLKAGDTIVLSETSAWQNADRIGFK